MAELGVIASIIGIAGVGIKLSKTLYQCGHKTVSANHQMNRVATQVTLFSSMLKHVGTVLQDARSLHSAEAEETTKQIVKECETVFQEITNIVVLANDRGDPTKEKVVANGRRRRLSVLQRAKWYFEQPKVDWLLAQLEYLKTTLSVLIQTLHLAAVTAKDKDRRGTSEPASDEVTQERLHVETLIAAQQLSVVVLQQIREEHQEADDPPSYSAEEELKQRYPKLLTLEPDAELALVKLGDGSLDFLERKHSSTEDGAPLEKSSSRSDAVIEELLDRWTIKPDSMALARVHRDNRDVDVEEHGAHTPTYSSMDEAERSGNEGGPPDVKLHHVKSVDMSPTTGVGVMSSPSNQWLDPNATTRPPRPGDARPITPPSSGSTFPPLSGDEQEARRLSLSRAQTNPESDQLPTINAFHDHHALQNGPPRASSFSSAKRSPQSPAAQPKSPRSSRSLDPTSSSVVAMAGQPPSDARPLAQTGPPLHKSNYRPPTSESVASTPSSSDSELTPPPTRMSNPYRTRRTSSVSKVGGHGHHDSGLGDGLNIPWRIRISPIKYFDFRDDKIVGPRTPYLPTESESWIYSHDNARTDISKEWVCEEALMEKRYQYCDLRDEQEGAGFAGHEGAWRILQPLKFPEVEALVIRTVDYFRQHQAAMQQSQTTGRPRPTLHTQMTQPSLGAPQGPPHASPTNIQRSPQPRSASFNDAGPVHPPPWTTGQYQQSQNHLRPNAAQWPPPTASGPYGTPWNSPVQPRGGLSWPVPENREAGLAPRSRHDRDRAAYNRDRADRSRDQSRERWLREKEHEREHGTRRHRERHRDREKERDKKTKHSSMAGTLTKIGALAALLEGLDGVML